jgi:hypothetical protein
MWRIDQYGNYVPDDMSAGDTNAPEAAAPISTNPALATAGINTTSPQADQAAQNAQGYDPSLYEEQGQVRNEPQVYGQAGDAYSPDEGPISPQETAERMPSDPDAMQKLINQHMLPSVPKASNDGYQNYVTASRQARAAEKDQLRQQGALNRADAADKDRRAMEQTIGYNAIQGAGPAAGGGYGGNNGRVTNIGGYTFVKGTWRPQDTNEAAHTNYLNAQTDYMRQRPDIANQTNQTKYDIASLKSLVDMAKGGDRQALEKLKQSGRMDLLTANQEFKAGENDLGRDLKRELAGNVEEGKNDRFGKSLAFKKEQQAKLDAYRVDRLSLVNANQQRLEEAANTGDVAKATKAALDTQGALDRTIGELKARDGAARGGSTFNKLTFGVLGQNESKLKDRIFDKAGKPGNVLEGSYGVLADEALRYADMLGAAHEKVGDAIPPPSPDQIAFLTKLRKERGQAAPEVSQGTP